MSRRAAILWSAILSVAPLRAAADDWPQWRGPELRGTSPEKELPLSWSSERGLAWKLALPSGSGSTPIVARDRVYLNVADGDTVFLWCVDRKTGSPAWKRPLGARRAMPTASTTCRRPLPSRTAGGSSP